MKNGTLLVSVQGLNKGQTLNILNIDNMMAEVLPDGYSKKYNVPIKYIKQPGEDLEYPRSQEIFSLWGVGNA